MLILSNSITIFLLTIFWAMIKYYVGGGQNLKIPQHEMARLARCLLPEIHKFFQSEEGKREFEEWEEAQKEKK